MTKLKRLGSQPRSLRSLTGNATKRSPPLARNAAAGNRTPTTKGLKLKAHVVEYDAKTFARFEALVASYKPEEPKPQHQQENHVP